MKKIPLKGKWGDGKVTIVDDDIAIWLGWRSLHVSKGGYVLLGNHRRLHTYINNTPKGFHTDHINGDKLDNRRGNLRTATGSQNGLNRHVLNKNNISGFSGVHYDKSRGLWMSSIKLNRKIIQLGRFTRIEDAVIAREAALKVAQEVSCES